MSSTPPESLQSNDTCLQLIFKGPENPKSTNSKKLCIKQKILDLKNATYIPYFFITVSLLEIIVYTQTTDAVRSSLTFDPGRKNQAWRFLTYMLLHVDTAHLTLNIIIQCVLGTPLEIEQGTIRAAVLYLGGGLAGSLGSSVMEPKIFVEGASAGVYAILMSQISHISLNLATLKYIGYRFIIVGVLLSADVTYTCYHIYTSGNERPRISWAAHASGALSGIFLGLLLFRGSSQWTKIIHILSGAITCFLYGSAIIFNLLH